jgi:hypothetical protein
MGPTDRNKGITPGLLSRFHFAKLDGFNHQAGCAKAPRAVSVRAITERAVAKTQE